MTINLTDKKLLVIGGGAYYKHLKKYKELKGFKVYSIDRYEDPRAEGLVDVYCKVSRTDVPAIAKIVKEENIDGIFVGSSEQYAQIAIEVCKQTSARFYSTQEQWDTISNKRLFKQYAQKCGFPVIPEFHVSSDPTDDEISALPFPVMIKPVDGSGARGLNICYDASNFRKYYHAALDNSRCKDVIIEKLITGAVDVFVNYTIQDGEATLSYAYTKKVVQSSEKNYITLPLFHFYPTRYLKEYYRIADIPAKKMIQNMGLRNGSLTLQGFYKDGHFMFYEAGYRLGGSQAYILTEYENGANVLHYMINYALTGQMSEKDITKIENARFPYPACNYYVVLKAGIIDHIEGIDVVEKMSEVLNVTQLCNPGDEIRETNEIGRAIFRLHVVGETAEKLAEALVKISDTLKIVSTTGEEMQIEHLQYDRCISAIKDSI
ncbi:MAG: hypothetical protein IKH63_08920 [Prevotella sp.]|nr:hypothetical protein [Prevotella sp.]